MILDEDEYIIYRIEIDDMKYLCGEDNEVSLLKIFYGEKSYILDYEKGKNLKVGDKIKVTIELIE